MCWTTLHSLYVKAIRSIATPFLDPRTTDYRLGIPPEVDTQPCTKNEDTEDGSEVHALPTGVRVVRLLGTQGSRHCLQPVVRTSTWNTERYGGDADDVIER